MPVDINAIMASSAIRVKLVFFAHFLLVTNALAGSFLPPAYLFYNLLFFVALFWTLHCKESADAVYTTLLIDAISIFLDIVFIIGWYNSYGGSNIWSIFFSIVNLVARPFTVLLLHKELLDRGGSINLGTVFPTANANGHQPTSYEDIDNAPKQSVPVHIV